MAPWTSTFLFFEKSDFIESCKNFEAEHKISSVLYRFRVKCDVFYFPRLLEETQQEAQDAAMQGETPEDEEVKGELPPTQVMFFSFRKSCKFHVLI